MMGGVEIGVQAQRCPLLSYQTVGVAKVETEGEHQVAITLEGRTVIVTGAGRGLGRAYALALAQRGACVVVNDVAAEHADEAVVAIRAAGGAATAAYDSVATQVGAGAIVRTALDQFGRLDGVINNAGYMRNGYFEDMTPEKLDAMLDVHIRGSFFVTQAAWPHLRSSGCGRVVMTSSAGGMFAMPGESNYAAAKAGVYGLAKALACEGREHGIRVNTVLPMASTTISAGDPVPGHAERYPAGVREALAPRRQADSVAPLVVYLASAECAVNGEAYAAGFGRYARVFVGEVPGWTADDPVAVTPEDIVQRLDEIRDLDGFAVPEDIYDEVRFIAASIGLSVPT
jgi:NAD(P)-dependent dehydrogenase (short-subunit alcohol dehydrogenase family)